MRRLVAALVAIAPAAAALAPLACGSPPPHTAGPGSSGTRPAPTAISANAACEAVRTKVAQLYRAELHDRDPSRIDEAIADNTAMVINDCLKTSDRTPACVTAATNTRELHACLIPLDDEGTEGDQLAH